MNVLPWKGEQKPRQMFCFEEIGFLVLCSNFKLEGNIDSLCLVITHEELSFPTMWNYRISWNLHGTFCLP